MQLQLLGELCPRSAQLDSRFGVNQYGYPLTLLVAADTYLDYMPFVLCISSSLDANVVAQFLRKIREWVPNFRPCAIIIDRSASEAKGTRMAYDVRWKMNGDFRPRSFLRMRRRVVVQLPEEETRSGAMESPVVMWCMVHITRDIRSHLKGLREEAKHELRCCFLFLARLWFSMLCYCLLCQLGSCALYSMNRRARRKNSTPASSTCAANASNTIVLKRYGSHSAVRLCNAALIRCHVSCRYCCHCSCSNGHRGSCLVRRNVNDGRCTRDSRGTVLSAV